MASANPDKDPEVSPSKGDPVGDKLQRTYEGMLLPNYLTITQLRNNGGIKISLDLGLETNEAARRLEEIIAMKTKETLIPLAEIDGPHHLSWDTFTGAIFRLLTQTNVKRIAVPLKQVPKIQGRLSGLVMTNVRSLLGTSPLKICGHDIKLRDVLSPSILTARVTALHSEDEQTAIIKEAVKKFQEENFVPKSLRSLICGLLKVIKKNERRERFEKVRAEKSKHRRPPNKPKDDGSSSPYSSHASDYSISDTESTGFDTEDVSMGDTEQTEQPGPSKYNTEPRYVCSISCYICKKKALIPKHHSPATKHYERLCPGCAEVNWEKRHSRVNLDGYIALVTGGRIKIGYETVLKLLRDGCRVITTTRFPNDAAKRYAEEVDYQEWHHRLTIYPLELKDSKGIYLFVEYLKQSLPHLDIIINNAAQTLRRPYDYYAHLLEYEQVPNDKLPQKERCLKTDAQRLTYRDMTSESMMAMSSQTQPQTLPAIDQRSNEASTSNHLPTKRSSSNNSSNNDEPLQKKRKVDALPENNTPEGWSKVMVKESDGAEVFPQGCLDEFGQQIDLRSTNSWRAVLEEVPISELLEVLMVNAIAPYILNKELKDMLTASPHNRRFIVNVSAMEGQFHRLHKTRFHPHTNMAKAALNMMTRTGALSYKLDSIFMTAVDTGWVTDERPFHMAVHESKKGFILPLDTLDGAARVYDPIVMGLTKDNKQPFYAVFLKNYLPHPW